jgi:hypothetical protein
MRSRWLITFLILVALSASSAIPSLAHQTEPASCGNDSLLVWPITKTGPLPDSEVLAYGLDGAERARFPIDRPLDSRFTTAPGRAIVLDQVGAVDVIDIPTESVLPLDLDAGDHPLSFVEEEFWVDLPADTSISAISPAVGDIYLVDLQTLETRHIGGEFGTDVMDLSVSPDSRLLAVQTHSGLLVGLVWSGELVAPLSAGETVGAFGFSPDGSKLALIVVDFRTDSARLVLADFLSGQISTIASIESKDTVHELVFLDDASVAYAVDQTIVVADLLTGGSSSHHVDAFDVNVAAASPDGLSLLYRGRERADDPTVHWFILNLATGATSSLDVSEASLVTKADQASRVLFQAGEFDNPTFVVVDLLTGQQTPILPGGAAVQHLQLLDEAPDGASALFSGEHEDVGSVWRVDYATGESILMADLEGTASAAFSPDECFVGVGD